MNAPHRSERRRAEVRQLGPLDLRGLTPSLRDFAQTTTTHRQGLALIVALPDPEQEPDAHAAVARAIDGTDAAAASVRVDPEQGGSLRHLASAARAIGAPVLANDWVVSREQLYRARLAGADAIVLQVQALPAGELRALLEIGASLHLSMPVEVDTPEDLEVARALGARQVVLPAGADTLAQHLPRGLSAIGRTTIATQESLATLRGKVDAVWLEGPWWSGLEPLSHLTALVAAAEGP